MIIIVAPPHNLLTNRLRELSICGLSCLNQLSIIELKFAKFCWQHCCVLAASGSWVSLTFFASPVKRFGLVDWHRLNCASSSPLGFSELFNEFRLHENLHSLDEILYAIIDADGMSFNDLKPIYKEFLLKLAVTLTQDELFQRSKNIMRRQKKKKQKRKASLSGSQVTINGGPILYQAL